MIKFLLFFSFLIDAWNAGQEYIQKQHKAVEQMAQQAFGDFRLFLMGFYPEKEEILVCGYGEISDTIRITAINGILNQRTDWLAFLQSISSSHGNINVHSTFWPSEGWTKDIYKCLSIQQGNINDTAISLAHLWRQMIDELGGIDSPGHILHYAHSIGAAETFLARSLLTPEECQKIHVVTFGTPHLFHNDHFASLTHYISHRDGICMLDAVNYGYATQGEHEHVEFIGDPFDGPPLIDHFVYMGTYQDKIHELGAQFVQEYGQL